MAKNVQLTVDIKGGDSVGKAAEATKNLKTQLRELQNDLQSGKLTGKAFDEGIKKAGQMKDQINDVNNRVKALATDGPDVMLKGFGDMAAGIIGGFAAAQGAMALFGSENEDLQKSLMKVQGAVALLNGVQAINNALQSDSKAIVALNTIKTNLLTFAQTRYTAAVGSSTGALKAFRLVGMTLGIGIVVAAITGLIYVFSQLESILPKIDLEQKALNDTMSDYAKGSSDANIEVHKMTKNFDLAKKGVISKEKALNTYNDKFGKTLGFAKDLNEAESIFIKKSESYVKLMGARAQANALYAKAAELSVKEIQEQTADNISSAEMYWTMFKNNFRTTEGQVESLSDLATENEKRKKGNIKLIKEEEKAILSAADSLVKKSLEEEKRLGISTDGDFESPKTDKEAIKKAEEAEKIFEAKKKAALQRAKDAQKDLIKKFDDEQKAIKDDKKAKQDIEEEYQDALLDKEIEANKKYGELIEQRRIDDLSVRDKELFDISEKYRKEQELALGNADILAQIQTDKDNALREKKLQFDAEDAALQQEADNVRIEQIAKTAEQAGQLINQLAGKNKAAALTALALEKGAAIANVLVSTQREIAAYRANPTWSLLPDGGAAIKATNIIAAKVRAGISIASISAAGISGAKNITGGGSGGSVQPPNIRGSQTTNEPTSQPATKVFVTETDIRSVTRKVDGIFTQATIQ